MSTRRVDDLIKALGCDGISSSQVSRICEQLDEVVDSFLGRPLDGGPYPYVWLDGLTQKVREGGRIVNVCVVEAGHSVLFAPAYRLVQELLAAKRDLDLARRLRKLDNFDFLLLEFDVPSYRTDVAQQRGQAEEVNRQVVTAFEMGYQEIR